MTRRPQQSLERRTVVSGRLARAVAASADEEHREAAEEEHDDLDVRAGRERAHRGRAEYADALGGRDDRDPGVLERGDERDRGRDGGTDEERRERVVANRDPVRQLDADDRQRDWEPATDPVPADGAIRRRRRRIGIRPGRERVQGLHTQGYGHLGKKVGRP